MENTGFKVYIEEKTQDYGRLYLEPLERGYGDTLGNALRRLLLSSIKGAAVTAVRIDGVLHEFSTINGIREDVIEILMNLKHIPIKAKTDAPKGDNAHTFKIITLDSEELPKDFFTREVNPGVITAKDLPWDNEFEFCGDGVLCTLEPNAKLLMEIYVERGVGYLSAERERPSQPSLPVDALLTDAIFSPVKRVNYQIENARVGQSIDYERLILEVWTNGALTPEEAVSEAARIAQSYFGQIADTVASAPQVARVIEEIQEPDIVEVTQNQGEAEHFEHPIHELELSIRSENCLLRGGIQTVGDLLRKSRDDLLKIRNLGKISLTEIEERLVALGYELKPSEPSEEAAEISEEVVVEETGEEESKDINKKEVVVDDEEKTPKKSKATKKAKTPKKESKKETKEELKEEAKETSKENSKEKSSKTTKKKVAAKETKESDKAKEPKESKTSKKSKETKDAKEPKEAKEVKKDSASKSKDKADKPDKSEAKPKAKTKAKSKAKDKAATKAKAEEAEKLVAQLSSKKAPEDLLSEIVKDAEEADFPEEK